jgi:hypothetical protein
LQRVATHLAQQQNKCVLLATRSWEPPTGELEDFITNAQALWPSGASIALVPLATQTEREPEPHQVKQWLRFAQRSKAKFVSVSILPIDKANLHTQTGPNE